MTLIVSVRTFDGIVLAGDSVATFTATPETVADVDTVCPKCSEAISVQATVRGDNYATTTLSYAQKIIPFLGTFGVGTYGAGRVHEQTVYLAVRQLEIDTKARMLKENRQSFTTLEVAELIGEYLRQEMNKDLAALQAIQPGFVLAEDNFPLGLQVLGYDGNVPTAHWVQVGNRVKIDSSTGINWLTTGRLEIVNKLGELYASSPSMMPLISGFSLQDAMEFAEFLITTTALHQRFSSQMPTVGGEIDIAIITPFNGFKWIRQKKLYSMLEGN